MQKLDGIESAENRIIIDITNHPEYIDPEFLRPGKFEEFVTENEIEEELNNKIAPVYVINKCLTSNI